MDIKDLVTVLDEEIERLQRARNILTGDSRSATRSGALRKPAESGSVKKKHQMSPEARAKIAEAQRARWAKQKKFKT